jgi:putative ABC transport system permease protein
VTAALFVAFAAVCLLLSTIGLYGVVTTHVVERTREGGIRMALGATRGAVLRGVLLEGATMTLFGMIGGAAIAALFSSWLETILYGVSREDAATIAAVTLLIGVVTGVATYIQARRAAKPARVLRESCGRVPPRTVYLRGRRAPVRVLLETAAVDRPSHGPHATGGQNSSA